MKFLLVSRKKYEQALKNCKVMNEQRMESERENIRLQKEVKRLEKLISVYEERFSKKEPIKKKKSKGNYFKQCKKCGKIFKIKNANTNRMKCDRCISLEKENRNGRTK